MASAPMREKRGESIAKPVFQIKTLATKKKKKKKKTMKVDIRKPGKA